MGSNGENLLSWLFLSSNPVAIKMVADKFAKMDEFKRMQKKNPNFVQEKSQHDKIVAFFDKIEPGLIVKFKQLTKTGMGFYPKNELILGQRDSIKGEIYGDANTPDFGWFVVTLNDPRCKYADPERYMKLRIFAGEISKTYTPALAMTYTYIDLEGKSRTRYCFCADEKTPQGEIVNFYTSSEANPNWKNLNSYMPKGAIQETKCGVKSVDEVVEQDSEEDDDWDTWYNRKPRKSTNSTVSRVQKSPKKPQVSTTDGESWEDDQITIEF